MEDTLTFEVILRRKVPYFTTFLKEFLFTCFAVLFIVSILMIPTKYLPDEMVIFYFIVFIPKFLKSALLFSSIGIATALPLLLFVRLHKKTTLTFSTNSIHITGDGVNEEYIITSIKNIFFSDPQTRAGYPKEVLRIYIQLKTGKTTSLRLKDYSQSESFMNRLMKYDNLEILHTDFRLPFYKEQ